MLSLIILAGQHRLGRSPRNRNLRFGVFTVATFALAHLSLLVAVTFTIVGVLPWMLEDALGNVLVRVTSLL